MLNHNTGSVINGDYIRLGDVLTSDNQPNAVVLWDETNNQYGVEIGPQKEWMDLKSYLEQNNQASVTTNVLRRS